MVVSSKGYDRLVEAGFIDDNELGKLKIEKKLSFFSAIAPKSYILQDLADDKVEIKCKGIGGFKDLNNENKLKMWEKIITEGNVE